MVSTTVNALVYQHLAKITPEIAEEFRSRYKCDPTRANAIPEDLVASYNHTIFTNSLVFKHLCKVSPNLVKYFKFHHTACRESLYDLVTLYEKVNPRKRKGDSSSDRRIKKRKGEKEGSVADLVVLYERINHRKRNREDSSKGRYTKISKTESVEVFDGDFLDTDLFMKELEKYNPCFASSESESEMDDDISVISEGEKSSKTMGTKNKDPPKNKLVTSLSEEDTKEFCHILDCEIYRDLQDSLDFKTCLDKLAAYILKKNILVRKVHQKLTSTNCRLDQWISSEILENGTFKFGHFNPKENSLIEANWSKLLEESNLTDSAEEALDIFRPTLARKKPKDGLKCNVIGLYLSQGMTKVRYTSDVFAQAKIVLAAKSRKLSPEEKNYLMEYVDKHGENCDWKELAYLLYKKHVRNGADVIKKIYFLKKNDCKRGNYELVEDKLILDMMFSESRTNTGNLNGFKEPVDALKILAKQLGRHEMSVYRHWYASLKPLLLQYHAGTLHLDIKRLLLNYLNDKKVTYMQDIEWSNVLSQPQFAGHTKMSLVTEFNNVRTCGFRAKKNEVTVPEMAEFINEKYRRARRDENIVVNGKRAKRIDEIVNYYKRLMDGTKFEG